ncbi:Osmotin, thaumatin-like protein [Heliocybe sulcata]|uniref:Osmotin, thaumatin-like protein n=1 Tax=Heliocybe sulcata TaxID=5364 RepID=A0A5C3MWX3_9AGAM|nr:Osmotin, thaumatin-like protein [Heliocybe sulcata]
MFLLPLVSFAVALSHVAITQASSVTVFNNCGDRVWFHEVYGTFSQVYAVDPGTSAALNQPPDGTGVAVNVYTGCSDDTATSCTTGGVTNDGGASPFIRAEATFTGGSVNYDISPLYGYNRAMKINTGGGQGVNSQFYHDACPNAYSFPDDDCANYGDSPDAGCGDNTDLTITVCPTGTSSNINLCT